MDAAVAAASMALTKAHILQRLFRWLGPLSLKHCMVAVQELAASRQADTAVFVSHYEVRLP